MVSRAQRSQDGTAAGYLGFVPISGNQVDFFSVSSGLGLLQIKLLKTNEKTVERLMAETFGRSYEAGTPEHAYVVTKARESGVDFLRGDSVFCTASPRSFDVVEAEEGSKTLSFMLGRILDHFVLPSKLEDDMAIFALLEQPPSVGGSPVVHALQLSFSDAEDLNARLAKHVAQLPATAPRASAVGTRSRSRDMSTVTIGIGLSRVSQLKIADELTRAGSIKLKGRRSRRSIRRDKKYGDTFESLSGGLARASAVIVDPDDSKESPLDRKRAGSMDGVDLELFSGGQRHGGDEGAADGGRVERRVLRGGPDETGEAGVEATLKRSIAAMKLRAISTDDLLSMDLDDGDGGPESMDAGETGDYDNIDLLGFGFGDGASDDEGEGEEEVAQSARSATPDRSGHSVPSGGAGGSADRERREPAAQRAAAAQSRGGRGDRDARATDAKRVQRAGGESGDVNSRPHKAKLPLYYHGPINKRQAEEILREKGVPQGAYLIRDSSQPGEFTLSIRNGTRVVHSRIVSKTLGPQGLAPTRYTLQMLAKIDVIDKDGVRGGPWFDSLTDVTEAFRKRPIPYLKRVSRNPKFNGRPVHLTKAVNKPLPAVPPDQPRSRAGTGEASAGMSAARAAAVASAPPPVNANAAPARSAAAQQPVRAAARPHRLASTDTSDLAVPEVAPGTADAPAAGVHRSMAGARPAYAVPEPLEETMLSQQGVAYNVPAPAGSGASSDTSRQRQLYSFPVPVVAQDAAASAPQRSSGVPGRSHERKVSSSSVSSADVVYVPSEESTASPTTSPPVFDPSAPYAVPDKAKPRARRGAGGAALQSNYANPHDLSAGGAALLSDYANPHDLSAGESEEEFV